MRTDVLRTFDRATTPSLALARWAGVVADSITPVRERANFVYRYLDVAGRTFFLRLTHESHRTRDQIVAELDFVNFLVERGARVAPPLRSRDGQLVETVSMPTGDVHAVVFEAVQGEFVKWGTDRHNRAVLFARGAALARLHRLSKDYRPPGPRRIHWHEDDLFTRPARYFRSGEDAVRRVFQELTAWLRARPMTPANYGMIHGDFGTLNTLLAADGALVAIDFDDCFYHWFAYDLAVAIRSARKLPERYRIAYVKVLLDGYATENDLCGDGPETIDWFNRLASLYQFVTALRKRDPSHVDPEDQARIDRRREALVNPLKWC